jgi:TolB protein
MFMRNTLIAVAFVLVAGMSADHPRAAGPLVAIGIFDGGSDVGTPSTIGAGSSSFDAATKVYTISGGGENMWAQADHFHYVWKKVTGDVTLTADYAFVGTQPNTGTPNGHRKAVLVIRQSLDSDAIYADAAGHGDGLTSLQYRDKKGDITKEFKSDAVGPKRLRIEKRGQDVSMFVGDPGGALRPSAGPARVPFTGEFYVGIGVTSHDTGRIETATFSNVELTESR